MDQVTALTQLADIVQPEAPSWWPVFLFIVTGIFLVGGFIWKTKKNRETKTSPQNQLIKIEHQWKTGELDDRFTAFWLASLLRNHLQLSDLPIKPPSVLTTNEQEWKQTLQLLNALRYKNSPQPITQELFETIHQWLKNSKNSI